MINTKIEHGNTKNSSGKYCPSFGTILELINKSKVLSRAEQSYAGKSQEKSVRPCVRASVRPQNKTLAKNVTSETNMRTKLEQQGKPATTARSKRTLRLAEKEKHQLAARNHQTRERESTNGKARNGR